MRCTQPIKLQHGQTADEYMTVPCGKCRACRINRVREWTFRLVSELPYWKESCFCTFTYSDLPEPTLNHKHFQDFMRRLRKDLNHPPLKYFMCGEYGGEGYRPHYHAIIFGWEPIDGETYPSGEMHSDYLEKTWKLGIATYGLVEPASCAYVAGYVQKKINNPFTYTDVKPPYIVCSKGIGKNYMEDQSDYIKAKKTVTLGPYDMPVPRYYRKKLDLDPFELHQLTVERDKKISRRYKKLKDPTMLHRLVLSSLKQKDADLKRLEKPTSREKIIVSNSGIKISQKIIELL